MAHVLTGGTQTEYPSVTDEISRIGATIHQGAIVLNNAAKGFVIHQVRHQYIVLLKLPAQLRHGQRREFTGFVFEHVVVQFKGFGH